MCKLSTYIVSCLALGLIAPLPLRAASIVAADDGGYAGRVIEKVGQVWAPPPGLRGNFSVRIRISVGEDGKVKECRATESSSLKAFDDAACGAVYNAAPFGKTPEGKPVDVHMAFRIGAPKNAPRELTFEEAARESVKERERLNNLIANEEAGFVATRARERAEAVAKKLGVELSDLEQAPQATSKPLLPPPPQTSPKPEKVAKQSKKTSVSDKSGGVLIGSSDKNRGPELVIKSNLKHLDVALEAHSEATADAQTPSVNSPITIVAPQTPEVAAPPTTKEQGAQEGGKVVVTPPEHSGGNHALADDELAVPPLESLGPGSGLPADGKKTPGTSHAVASEQKMAELAGHAKPAIDGERKPGAAKDANIRVPEEKKSSMQATGKTNVAEEQPDRQTKPETKAETAPSGSAPVEKNISYADYLERIKKDIQQSIILPGNLPAGRHIVSVQLYLGRSGRIYRSDLIHTGSNVHWDMALAKAIRQVGTVTPPPTDMGRNFPLTMVFEVQQGELQQ